MKKRITLLFALACGLFLISGTIDLDNLFDYSGQVIPNYITEDNTPAANPITDAGATLGRVLFYDKNLSHNNTVSCASCHKQEFAFGDVDDVSIGWDGGSTARHSTRLVNARFGEEVNFFWDERASSLEMQTTMPIQDHVEMGFSGASGNGDMSDLITKLEGIDYYQDLFTFVYGDFNITESEIQDALAQFVRSIQSFDSKFDIGRAQVNNQNNDFPNFTASENLGKTLYLTNAQDGGANCNTCHQAPEFDIDPDSDNNSVITVAGDPNGVDVTNTRSPSLRDMVNPDGTLNGPLMHDGSFTSLMDVIDLYDDITIDPANTNLDNRLNGGPGGNGQNLNLTQTEKNNLVAFLGTLTGVDLYTAEEWSDPFDTDGNITILNSPLPVELFSFNVEMLRDDVLLEWETASEINNKGFEIQHSRDAVVWEPIGFVNGQGDASYNNFYDFIDEEPFFGNNYYRLKQMDFDGTIEFTKTLSIFIDKEAMLVNAYPNPVVDNLQIDLSEGSFTVTVMNGQGRVLNYQKTTNNTNIDFSRFDAGVYFLLVKNNKDNTEEGPENHQTVTFGSYNIVLD